MFWIAIGTPLVFATYQGLLGISTTNTTLIAVKQSVNGVLNTTAAYLLAISLNAGSREQRTSGIAIRNLITGLTLILVLTSYLLATTLSGLQIGRNIILAERDRLSLVASITSQLAKANGLENTVLNILAPGVLGNDSDVDDDPITAVLYDDVGNGTLSLSSDGAFTYTPNTNFAGQDSFAYRAYDGMDFSAVMGVSRQSGSWMLTPEPSGVTMASSA